MYICVCNTVRNAMYRDYPTWQTGTVVEYSVSFYSRSLKPVPGVCLVTDKDPHGWNVLLVIINVFYSFTVFFTSFPIFLHAALTCRSNNPVLLSFIQSQTPHLSKVLVQRLIISTIAACPDLLLPYMRALPFSLEPRLSSKWVNSVEFIVKVRSVSGLGLV